MLQKRYTRDELLEIMTRLEEEADDLSERGQYRDAELFDNATNILKQIAEAKPIALVPVHPRLGLLLANSIASLDADHPRYPLQPLYELPVKE